MKKQILILSFMACFMAGVFAQHTIENPFFDHVPYSGAFGTTDWTAGWANFNPQNTVYPVTTTTVGTAAVIQNTVINTNTTWSPSSSPVTGAASFTDSYVNNSFFEPVSFVGAFGPTDWTAGWSNFDCQNTVYPATTVTIPAGDITTNTTWTSGNVYKLNGYVYVKNGVTLTIQAGTVIRGDKVNKGTLIIERGGKLIANGTASQPIVFTSNQAAGSRDYGDWGGIIICGRAKNNQGTDVLIEGGVNAYYGGNDDADNSGSLQYVRLEFPGIAFSPNNEINGLTMGSVGSGTTLDYIQVSYSGDDAFEWFGGTVNAKHLIAYRSWDDDMDTDFGYRGMVQFAVVLRDPNVADVSGSNAFEADNDGGGTTAAPLSKPIFSNVSVFGPKATTGTSIHANYQHAMHLRRNTSCSVFNSFFSGFPWGLYIDGSATQTNATADNLRIENTFMVGMNANYKGSYEGPYFTNAARNNQILAGAYGDNSALQIANPFNLTAPNFLPTKNVYLLNGWVYVPDGVTLTIQPGTIIRGDKTNKGALIIERGGKLNAIGNVNEPIVFTSNQAVGSRAPGDWGGIIVCGKAYNNQGANVIIEGGTGATFGGTNDADNSGTIKYVRIEYAGVAFAPDNEINGLTMGSVGSGTTIDYVQVSYGGDDAFEWFGGTVNAKHLIAYASWDDDFDTDFGYTGMVQYAVSLRDPNYADVSGSNSFESDNNAAGNGDTPLTNPLFSNVSVFGPKATSGTSIHANFKRAMHIRRNSRCSVYNALFMGFPTGLLLDGTGTQGAATANTLQIENSFMSGMTTASFATSFEDTYWNTGSRNNTAPYANNTSMMITDPFTLTSPNFLPMAGSPVMHGSRWSKTITGKVEYANSALTDLDNVTVLCKDASGHTVSSATTNATGDYTVYGTDGAYTISIDCSKTPGGITATDAQLVRLASAGSATLSNIQQLAADVNLDGNVNVLDAGYIRKKAVNAASNPQYIIPNFVFEAVNLNIATGAGTTTQNIKGLSGADVNGSFTPASK
ncbi:MAG: hypothetical protein PHQ65_11850 [Bacteroidales bacterium]|nr:hypothetical protein [Bacteroidales bacterium]MDD3665951.1 hypothetical protein [Bacteroidales bacterium]